MAGACRGSPAGVGIARGQVARGSPRPWLPPAALPAHEVSPEGNDAYRRGICPRQRRAALPPAQGRRWRSEGKEG
ncbi:hypothetical protein BHM03_00015628 [Ensete ventricosum]|nr:hypothetical protein BHM03_00015628 [Ensete ventricosum]